MSLAEFVYCSLTSLVIKMNFILRHLLNLSIAPLPAEECINFVFRFIPDLCQSPARGFRAELCLVFI